MELLKGETLGSKLLRDERLSLEETAALLLPVTSAVGAAHSHGIVHRDLKPENLFLAESTGTGAGNSVKVLHFGITKLPASPLSRVQAARMAVDAQLEHEVGGQAHPA